MASYESVAAGQTAQVLGTAGKAGDHLETIVVTANTNTITILDGGTSILVLPASTPLGAHYLNLRSVKGPWSITTGASTACTCIGSFA